MKIGIIGSGAMGSVYGGILGSAGNELWMFDKWAEHVAAMRANGLRVVGRSGDRTARVNATSNAEEAGACELAIIATKAMDTHAAIDAARPMIGPETLVLTIQNGLGNGERVEQVLGPENLLFGIAGGFGASMVGPGHVHHNNWDTINLAEFRGGLSDRLEQVAQVWRDAGFAVQTFDDLNPMVWGKLMGNVCVSAICTVTGMRVGQVRTNEWAWGVALDCVREAAAVARAKGVELPYPDAVAWVTEFVTKLPDARPSMYLDVQAGRHSEIDSIHGGVVEEGAKLGVPTPTCALMVRLVKALEQKAIERDGAYRAL